MEEHGTDRVVDQQWSHSPEPQPFLMIARKCFVTRYLHWIFLAFLGLFVYWEYGRYSVIDQMEDTLFRLAQETRNLCVAKIDTACNDLQYVRTLIESQVQENGKIDKKQLESILAYFSYHKKAYDQIRYIDAQGQELLRVNLVPGGPVMIADSNLQNKAHRPYFEEAMSLKPGEIYISDLDLNQEYGKVEVPHKPVFRLAVPIFDENDKAAGIVVLNILARKLREECRYFIVSGLPQESQIYLNLLGPDQKELMSPVSLNTEEVWNGSDARVLKTYIPVSRMSIPAYKVADSKDPQLASLSNKDIFDVEVSIPANVVRTMYAELFAKILLLSGPLLLAFVWVLWLLAKSHATVKFLNDQIVLDSLTDSLTGLYDRSHGLELLEQIRDRSARTRSTFSLFKVKINKLKEVNDIYGYRGGDTLIASVAKAIKQKIQKYDVVYRMSGDEFIVVLPGTDITTGYRILEEVYGKVLKDGVGKFPPYGFSFSYGGIEESQGEYGDIDDLLEAANIQMYEFQAAMEKKTLTNSIGPAR